jgi:hypothetical protein
MTKIIPSGPDLRLSKLAEEVVLQQALTTIDSPCGSNCSYTTQVRGPVFNCTVYNSSEVSLFRLFEPIGGNLTAQESCPLCTYPIYLGAENSTSAKSIFQFDLQFIYSTTLAPFQIKNATVLSCTAYDGAYTVASNFSNGIGTFEIVGSEAYTLLNPSPLQSLTIPATADDHAEWDAQSLSIYSQMNSISIAEALGNALSGNLTTSAAGEITANGGTMILESALNTDHNGSFIPSIDPTVVEHMLQNLTVSIVSFGQWNNTVAVHQIKTRICYSFQNGSLLPPMLQPLHSASSLQY